MIFEQVASGGCRSYLIGCADSCAAVLIDPELSQVDRYLALAVRDGLRIHCRLTRIACCEFGRISTLAAATLRQLGYQRAVALDGGVKAWREAGYTCSPGVAGYFPESPMAADAVMYDDRRSPI